MLKNKGPDMIRKDIDKLKESINQTADIAPERKAELNCLLDDVLAKLPAHEKEELKESEDKMKHLVGEFEANHPELAELINRISLMLSNIGV